MNSPKRLATPVLLVLAACGGPDESAPSVEAESPSNTQAVPEEDHAHDEQDLGTITIGEIEVTLAQGHGAVAAGEEGHLVVKLSPSDRGATTVRAWIGTEDRTQSYVGKAEYSASHDDYDVHATAPDPLPPGVMWWVEIERPDRTKAVGSVQPLID